MDIVINIPDVVYRIIKDLGPMEKSRRNQGTLLGIFLEATEKGTPLPKGHGRLIDADALEYEIASVEGYSELDYECVAREDIDQAPTIIEADRSVGNANQN